jgi:hypothetical protein
MTQSRRFVALYGSQAGDWRKISAKLLEESGVAWHDPTDPRWEEITHENGDTKQELIDELVAEQHRGMQDASCVIYHLASQTTALAARCELGFLTGKGIRTFVHVESDVEGRNYLWAQIKPYPHMVRCATLAEALREAVKSFS